MKEEEWWLNKAEDNLITAEVNLNNDRLDAAAFYAHQAAEKALKTLFIIKYKRLWKIHDLVELGRKVDAPQEILEACDILNPHYIETRYPTESEYTNEIVEEALLNSKKVIAWVKEKINQTS